MRISAIVAVSQNDVIGVNNQLPWHLPADLRHFKQTTMGHPIIMGRKTYESIGKPLPGRANIIITRDPVFSAKGCQVVHSVDEAIQCAAPAENVFVIGGASLFEAMHHVIERWYLTVIHADFQGDTYLSPLDPHLWRLVSQQDCQPDDSNAYSYSFILMDRI